MFVAQYGECGDEFSELTPMCSGSGSSGGAQQAMASEAAPARHRTHPLTWIVTAALLPLLCWDAWQSLQEAKTRSRTHSAPISQVDKTSGLLEAHNSH